MRHDQKMAEAWRQCVEFNDQHSIGDTITVEIDGESRQTKTTSIAWAQSYGEAVVAADKICQPVALSRVNKAQPVAS